MKRSVILLVITSTIMSCSKVEDYMLGKDNTPKPASLEKLTPKMDLVNNWSIPTGSYDKDKDYKKLQPVIKKEIIYTVDSDGIMQAINKAKGNVLWKRKINHSIVSGPSLSTNMLFITTGNSEIIAFSTSDGKEQWKASLTNESLAKPVVANNKILVKTIDGNLFAFNKNDGTILWKYAHGAPNLVLRASSSPTVKGKYLIAGFSDGKVDALDISNGKLLWQRSISYIKGSSDVERLVGIDANPIVNGNIVYVGSYQGSIGAISITNGRMLWKKPISVYKDLTFSGNKLYLTDSNDVIWAMNAENGKVLWKQPSLKARDLTKPTIIGNKLVVGDKMGLLHVLSAKNGEFLTRTKLSGAVKLPPVADNDMLYVQTANGRLNRLSIG